MNNDIYFYDSKKAVSVDDLLKLYRFTYWAKTRQAKDIETMLKNTSMIFSARHKGNIIAFGRVLTDFVFRASIWDFIVHPDYQGRGLGKRFLNYILNHPALIDIPIIVMFLPHYRKWLTQFGFEEKDGLMVLIKKPIELT